MERLRETNISQWLDKLTVDHEPGLTTAQLMLANEDLKPGMVSRFVIQNLELTPPPPVEPARRQWGPWNYVGFWIADAFNIGECVWIMIAAIWHGWENVPNGIPSSSGVTTSYFVSFFIFWLLSLPAIWFPVHKIRHLFTVKAYTVPVAGILFFVWALVRAHGAGPIIHAPTTLHGSQLAWQVVKGIMSCIANFATLICNAPDFSRVARKPKDALWSQMTAIPVSFAITSFVGIFVSSSSTAIYGEAIWNPLDLLKRFLENASTAARVGIFFIAFAFALAQLGTNIAANSISAGTDMTALLPRFITIRRGGYICALISLAINPWKLVSSGSNFSTYLSAYSVFLSSIAGVMICDYYLVRKGFYQVRNLYSAQETGPYWYWHGINWRAYASYFAGLALNMPGFVRACGGSVPIGAEYVFNVNFFGGFLVSAGCYYILCHFFPVEATSDHWMEVGDDITDGSIAYDAGDSGYDVERGTGQDIKGAEIFESGIRDRKGGQEV
ncbi:MAG: hypothetical protein M1819_007375 [Sarea resinae]|nr:MAG: hypothetical protein M1819_007375 [Sarea resinae]